MPVYVQTPTVTLPYPGLRPFRRDEFEIFFGREEHVAKLAGMLQAHHFVAVVGPSGCGKSSLVTAGLLPQLAEGHVVDIEGPWYEATIRPGDRPFSRLAEALIDSGALPDPGDDDLASRIGFLDAALRRGPLGLIQAIEEESLKDRNLLIVVDQFEEIFRFRHEEGDQEADAFMALLLETVRQAEERDLPIYVMLTMRSDYLGDCNQFSGLPEAISESQFLTPRPNREQRHSAIVGPAAMFGGEVEAPLVNRLLNDMGDDPDQLPIMQHALMRMWSLKTSPASQRNGEDEAPETGEDGEEAVVLTTDIYKEVGGWQKTLSNHADEAFDELGGDASVRSVAKIMFRSLTQRGHEQHDVRRPVSVQEVADAANVDTDLVKEIASAFRRPDRSFMMPPMARHDLTGHDLDDDDILDISHESLIRQWERLRKWAGAEGESAATYGRLEDAAQRWAAGREALLQSPGLDVALQWREEEQPTAGWARRYGPDFELVERYLDESRDEKKRLDAREETQRAELVAERARANEQAQTGHRLRQYMTIIGAVSVLCVASTVWALVMLGKAKTAKNDAKTAESVADAAERNEKVAKIVAVEAEKEVKKTQEKLINTKAKLLGEAGQKTLEQEPKEISLQADALIDLLNKTDELETDR